MSSDSITDSSQGSGRQQEPARLLPVFNVTRRKMGEPVKLIFSVVAVVTIIVSVWSISFNAFTSPSKRSHPPSPLKAHMPSPKKRKTVSSTKTDDVRKLTHFSPQQLSAHLMKVQPFDHPLTTCSSEMVKDLCIISEKGGAITTQTQLLMISHPMLIRVCQLVETHLSIEDTLFCSLEPREEIEVKRPGPKPKYGDDTIYCHVSGDGDGGEDGGGGEDSGGGGGDGGDGGDGDGEGSGAMQDMICFGKVPIVVHEIDVNVTMEKLRSKGLAGCSHIFQDYPATVLKSILLLVTLTNGDTEAIEITRDEQHPVMSYRSFNLLKSTALLKPEVVIEQCVQFVNYVAGWVSLNIPKEAAT